MGSSRVRAARWLLLVALALGVCGMHSLGHISSDHATHGMVATDQAPGVGEKMPDLDPTAVCLAVLTSLLVLLVTALGMRSRRSTEDEIGTPARAPCVARPPPRPTRSRLALVSVLRI